MQNGDPVTRDGPSGGEDQPARKPFLLRLPPDVLTELRSWASHEFRSLNGQIEYLLRDALKRRGRPQEDDPR